MHNALLIALYYKLLHMLSMFRAYQLLMLASLAKVIYLDYFPFRSKSLFLL